MLSGLFLAILATLVLLVVSAVFGRALRNVVLWTVMLVSHGLHSWIQQITQPAHISSDGNALARDSLRTFLFDLAGLLYVLIACTVGTLDYIAPRTKSGRVRLGWRSSSTTAILVLAGLANLLGLALPLVAWSLSLCSAAVVDVFDDRYYHISFVASRWLSPAYGLLFLISMAVSICAWQVSDFAFGTHPNILNLRPSAVGPTQHVIIGRTPSI